MFLGAVLGPFCPNFGKNEFSLRKGLCQFLNVLIILTLHQKSEKTNEPFLRKMLSCWTDRQTTMTLQDPPQDGGPIIKTTLSFPEFISTHQKPVYSINFFVKYSKFQRPAIRMKKLFMIIPTSIFFNQLLISMNFYHTLEIYLI